MICQCNCLFVYTVRMAFAFNSTLFVCDPEHARLLGTAVELVNGAASEPTDFIAEINVRQTEDLGTVWVRLGYVASEHLTPPTWREFTLPIDDAIEYLLSRPADPDAYIVID